MRRSAREPAKRLPPFVVRSPLQPTRRVAAEAAGSVKAADVLLTSAPSRKVANGAKVLFEEFDGRRRGPKVTATWCHVESQAGTTLGGAVGPPTESVAAVAVISPFRVTSRIAVCSATKMRPFAGLKATALGCMNAASGPGPSLYSIESPLPAIVVTMPPGETSRKR